MKWLEISPIKKYSWSLPILAIISFFIYDIPSKSDGLGGLGWAILGFYIIPIIVAIISFSLTFIENRINKKEKPIIKAISCMILSLIIYFAFLFVITNLVIKSKNRCATSH